MSLFDKVKQQISGSDQKNIKEIERLRSILQTKPNDPETLRQLGISCETNGLTEEAVKCFSILGRLYQQSQAQLAIAYFRKAEKLAEQAERASILKDIAKTYFNIGQFEETYRTSRQIIEIYLEINQKDAARGFVQNLPLLGEKDSLYRKELREMIGEKDESWAQGARGTWVEESSPRPTQLIASLPGYTAAKVPTTPAAEKALLAQMKVLVVDDDQGVCKILSAMLKSLGCQSVTANNGTEAIEKVFELKPNLIISDLLMPQMDGNQFFAKLQEDPETSYIPFVCLSSRGQEDEKLAAFSKGVEDYWVKPFVISELSVRTKKILLRQLQSSQNKTSSLDDNQSELSGKLGSIPLPHLLRMLEYMSKTGVLTLTLESVSGNIYFQDGAIIDAEYGGLNGEIALFSLISWTEGRFVFESQEITQPRIIVDPLDELFNKFTIYYQNQT
ncbi:MAG: response regulator [Acidobacteria bacterium]|nr:response regulator [Acidobacteriota bacterium]